MNMNATFKDANVPSSSLGFAQRQLNRFSVEEEALHQPRIIMGKSFYGGKGQIPINGDHQFNRSISSNMNGQDSMSKTFGTYQFRDARSPIEVSSYLPPQPRMLKIKSLKPIKHSNSMQVDKEQNLSLGESLRQNRVLREHIDKERAENLQSKLIESQQVESTIMRIRPATPRLNLLKMKKQHQLPLQPQVQPLDAQNLRRRKPQKLAQLEPLSILPILPQMSDPIPEPKPKKKKKKRVIKSPKYVDSSPEKLSPKYREDEESPIFERDVDEDINFYDQQPDNNEEISENEEEGDTTVGGAGLISNFQEKFEEIIENQEVSDAIELNEKFLAEHLGVEASELSRLTKIELRVDTSCHNLQVTGEILSSLEYLRMSDSIIKCFRDIGTSFRFVRILHLARCELKEVQGIQAFINLEELYISYNDIDDLFDIGFLEHLNILDLEGNNIKSIDQLYYLKRCQNLTQVSLKYNPVSYDDKYYSKLTECVPSLEYLDDRILMDYIPCAPVKSTSKVKSIVQESELIKRLLKIVGVNNNSEAIIASLCQKQLEILDNDEDDLIIMVNNIKSYCPEKKAQRQFFDNMLEDLETDQLFRRTTFSQSFKNSSAGKNRPGSGLFKNTAGTSFYKTSTRKSTAMTNENDGGICNQSDEKTQNSDMKQQSGKKKILTISRSRIKPAQSNTVIHQQINQSQERLPHDIFSLINNVDNQLQKNKDEIREKLAQNSSQASFFSGNGESVHSKSVNRIRLNPYSEDQQQLEGGLHSSAGGFSSKIARGSAGNKGPMRIVIRPQDIQFTKTFKNAKDTD